jgi:hypothetical protein
MVSDRARVSYDPSQQYRSVVMQQGRVTVEADWNEAQLIASEETRLEALDFVGPAGTPDNGYAISLIPGSFDFNVGAGIMYVGGIRVWLPSAIAAGQTLMGPYIPVSVTIAAGSGSTWTLSADLGTIGPEAMVVSNPGNAAIGFAFTGSISGATLTVSGLTYSQQQANDWLDWPNDPSWVGVPKTAPTSNEYVYLFLREQEVSAVEDSDLKDIALGGPDTAQRTRLVQHVVRLETTGTDCPSALTAAQTTWATQGFALNDDCSVASFARLQVGFVPPSTMPTPCDPTAQSGYLGADNQLIRVQVSDPKAGPQCLLWGYDDASFLYKVTVTSATSVTLQSAPVDAEHIPQSGQVVEVLMAAALLSNGQYVAAPTGQIFTLGASAYDPDSQILTLPSSLNVPLYGDGTSANPSPPQVFLRIWEGTLPITPGAYQTLPNTGVQVNLTSTKANNVFRGGDYWMFAVRPALPTLVYPERYASGPQPPDGPREWICPLAVLAWTASTPIALSCRNLFNNLVDLTALDQGGCCSVYVAAAGHNQGTFTIQDAIGQILSTGGRVCLGPGTFNLTSTLEISGATLAIEICGMGAAALFQTTPGVTTLNMATPATPQTASVPAILINNCQGVTIQDLELNFAPGYVAPTPPPSLAVASGTGTSYPNPGIMIQSSRSVTVQRCTLACTGNQLPTNAAIAIGGFIFQTAIQNNIIGFSLSNNSATPALGAGYGLTNLPVLGADVSEGSVTCYTYDLLISNNFLQDVTFGVELDATCYHLGQVEISGNIVGPSAAAIVVAGSGLAPVYTRIEINNNQVIQSYAGIACGLAARIENNDMTLLPVAAPSPSDTTMGGIVILAPVLAGTIDGLQIIGNRITGGSGFGILIEAQLGSAVIANNVLENIACGGIYAMAGADHLSIANNQLLNLVPNSSDPGVGAMFGAYGILLGPATTNGTAVQGGYVEILGNVIKDFATDSSQETVGSASRYAIALQGYNSTLIANNQLINIGPPSATINQSAGIYVWGYPFDRIDVSGNVIRRNDAGADSGNVADTGTQWYGVLISGFERKFIRTTTGPILNQRIIPTGDKAFVGVSNVGIGGILVNVGGLQNVNMAGNYVEAAGNVSGVFIDVGGNCIFTGNQCNLATAENTPVAILDAAGVVVSNNVLSSSAATESNGLAITATPANNFTVLGNIVSGGISASGSLSAWQALNVG